MRIQVNMDNRIGGTAPKISNFKALVAEKLARFGERITRVEVHLTDANGPQKTGGDDIRCLLEVRLAGLQPVSVTERGNSQDQALRGAVNKMQNLIDRTLGKLEKR
ncbi:MAG: HPF/RaiA family ribosome-associated protein [Phycisphaerae bacterium]|nr:HPF/RaiA family ribosome-associated protein [Phycisphaerae bacterium]